MLQVSIKALLSAIEEADVYRLPDMSAGADYIYNNLYRRLSHGEELRLSSIEWNRFELDDVDTIRRLHFDVIEADESKANAISYTLRGLKPITTAAAFV